MNKESVKAKLKNFAIENNHTFQEVLTYYGLERVLYRISISKYKDKFVLKGGIFLYAIFDRKYGRATTDMDFLARMITNSGEEIKKVFQEIFSQYADDALVFDPGSVQVEDIGEFNEYHGLNVSAIGYLDKTKIPISIDIGYGDVIYPDAVEMSFPVILDMDEPQILAYSLESAVAEKLEAIIKIGFINSRYKDFYDIYLLSFKHKFSYPKLRKAVITTFSKRETPLKMSPTVFGKEFINDQKHQSRWNAFLKTKKAIIQASLEDVMKRIKVFVHPLIAANESAVSIWDPKKGCWK